MHIYDLRSLSLSSSEKLKPTSTDAKLETWENVERLKLELGSWMSACSDEAEDFLTEKRNYLGQYKYDVYRFDDPRGRRKERG